MASDPVARLLQLADIWCQKWVNLALAHNGARPCFGDEKAERDVAEKQFKDALRAALTPPNSLTKDEMLAKMVEVLREWPSPIAKGNAKILAGLAINRGFVLEGTVLTPPPGGA